MDMNTILVAVLVGLVSVGAFLSMKRAADPCCSKNPPPGPPIIGHFAYFNPKSMIDNFRHLSASHAPIYELFAFFKRYIIVVDVPMIREILSRRPKIFRRPFDMVAGFRTINMENESVFIAEGSIWSRLRRLTSPPFNRSHIDAMFSSICDEARAMIERWKHIAKQNKEVDMAEEMMLYTLRVVMRVALGNFSLVEKDSHQLYVDLNTLFAFLIERTLVPLPDWLFALCFRSHHAAQQADRRIHAVVESMIANERTNNHSSGPMNLIQVLLNESNDEENKKLSPKELIANVKTFLLGGTETTSVTLTWCVYFLSQHPALVEAIRNEADEHFGAQLLKHNPSITQCNLPLCDAVIKESLRLKSPTPFLFFNLTQNEPFTFANGLKVIPGDTIICHSEGISLNDTIFPNACIFDPYRWIHASAEQLEQMNSALLAFGGGPRVCPGMHLAYLEARIALAAFVCHFDVSLACDIHDIKRCLSFTARAEKMPVCLTCRP